MKELLVPVGSMNSLIVAIKNGADAVYLGGKKYGARASATNFDDEEMVEAIKLCHLYGVKIYVTVNTLIYESEFSSVVSYVKFLHESGVDAIIVQDLGLISYLRNYLPNLEIHASTQVHNTNLETIKFLENLGVKRVVLARELSIDEISDFDTHLEIEAFIHGALCVSYSGECLFSSRILNRSGNRGECAQMCRLPYSLLEDGKVVKTNGNFLLSPKELNISSRFKEIMESNIYSLKIEGRMKSPEYVGCVTKLYRSLIDEYEKNKTCKVNLDLLEDISLIFNRDFTNGFLFNSKMQDIMNIKTSNHQGLPVGEIIGVDKKFVKVRLIRDLNQGDGIRFCKTNEGMICNYIYDHKEKLISGAKKGDIVLLDKRFNLDVGDIINKTYDVTLSDKYINIDYPKINISAKFKAHKGEEMELILSDEENEVKVSYGKVQEALKVCTTEERILEQLSKLGNTPFKLTEFSLDVDNNVFINIKDINELRRMATEKLKSLRENKKKTIKINEDIYTKRTMKYSDDVSISFLVRNEKQLKYLIDKGIKRIYVLDKQLFKKYKGDNVFYRTNRVHEEFDEPCLVTEIGNIKSGGIGDYFLNVTNHETINLFSKYLDIITLSCELENDEIANIMTYYNGEANVELVLRSRLELMLMKYCPLSFLVNKDKVCHVCQNGKSYSLVGGIAGNEKIYPIVTDTVTHTTHILNHELTDKLDDIKYYYDLGIRNFRIELFDEDEEQIAELLNKVGDYL